MRTHLIYSSIILILAFFLYKQCTHSNAASVIIKNVPVKMIVHDTPKVVKTNTAQYFVIPQALTKTKIVYIHDSVSVLDTNKVVQQCAENVFYRDTVRTKYGYVVIVDTLQFNRLAGRSTLFDLTIPETTITKAPEKQMLLMGGIDIGFGIGAGVAYKSKKDKLYSLDYMLTQHGGILILGYKTTIKIHL